MKELEVRYSKEKAEHQKDRLLQDQKNMQQLLILSFILGASVFLVGCLLYQRRIRLKDQELYEAKDIAHYYEDKYIESIKEIEREKTQIDQWNTEVQVEKECLLKQNMFQLDRLQENKIQLEEKMVEIETLKDRNQQLEEQIENSERDSDSHKAESMEKELLLKSGEEELKLLQEEKNRLEREILNSSDLYRAYDALKCEVQARNKDVEQLKADTSELTKSNHSLMTFVLKDSEIQKRLNEGGEPHLTPELWLSIQHTVKEIDPDFSKKLKKQAPSLNDKEKLLCYLIKLNAPLSRIAVFLDISKPSISRYKSLIVKKHFGRNDCILLDRLLLVL